MKIQKTLLKVLVSLVFIIIILLKIDFSKTILAMSTLNLWILLIYPMLVVNGFFLNSFNLQILFRAINQPIKFKKLFKSYILAWLFGKVSTGKSGEMSIVYFLNKQDSPTNSNLFVVIFDKIITFTSLILTALVGTLYLFKPQAILVASIVGLILGFTILMIIFNEKIAKIIKTYFLRKYSKYFKNFRKNFKHLVLNKKKSILINFIITFAKHINTSFIIFIIFLAMKQYVSPLAILFIGGIEGIITQIPISFSGIGVSEGIAIVLYQNINIEPYLALSAYLYVRILGYIFGIIVYLLYLIFDSKKN